jgi:uncharacterized membrane protein YedE/YeeE
MTEEELASLTTRVLWGGFGTGVLFGAVAQRTHFCTMGAVADIVAFGDWTRMRMWALAIGVAVIGFNAMVGLGWLSAADTIYSADRLTWLSHLAGGLLFGFGMVLASGCGSKTLVRVGGGSLKALVVLLAMGLAAYATMRGITAVLRVSTVDAVALSLPAGQDLPSLLAHASGRPVRDLAWGAGLVVGGALLAWVLLRAEGRRPDVLFGGSAIGAVVLLAWWLSGVFGRVEEHPLTLELSFAGSSTRSVDGMSFVAPVANLIDWLILFSDASRRLSIAVACVVGVVVGSAAVALATRSFRWEGFGGTEDTAHHLAGGALMGVGGVTAMGCTIGQGLSGVSTLSLGSAIALAAILGGAWLGLRYQVWRLERLA